VVVLQPVKQATYELLTHQQSNTQKTQLVQFSTASTDYLIYQRFPA